MTAQSGDGDRPPNIILFHVDDLGWKDTGSFGSDLYQTPNIDRLAKNGTKFTNAYAAATVCSPTRGALMTGMYPARTNLTDWIPGHRFGKKKLLPPDWTKRLKHDHTTIAEALKQAGYATAHVGKWHLAPTESDDTEEYYPTDHGFDVNFGGNHMGQPPSYYYPYSDGNEDQRDIIEHLPDGRKTYLTRRLTDHAIQFIEKHWNEPFFINFAYYNVHYPYQPRKTMADKYHKMNRRGKQHQNPRYAGMVQSVDYSVGRILNILRTFNIDENTLIVFAGDNGGTGATSMKPLRNGKGSPYEGGVRVPWIMSWPGVTEPGTTSDEPVITMDLYPTFLEAAGAEGDAEHNKNVDGLSLVPLMKNPDASLDREAIYFHYPHYHPGGATPYSSLRKGKWKFYHFYEDDHVELYNLQEDIGEEKDLSSKKPEKVKQLRNDLEQWRENVNAQPPRKNPDYEGGN